MSRNAFAFALSITLACSLSAQRLRDARLIDTADGCVTTVIAGCDRTIRAQLAAGDCTFSDGTRYDRFTVSLPPSRSVGITLRPLVSSYTNPWLAVIPPTNDGATPPVLYGPVAATVWIQTGAAGGTWTILAGTLDLFASGAYALHVDCFDLESSARDCVTQELLCGHHAEASLTAESCRFNSSNRAYGNWSFYGQTGDLVNLEMQSTAFESLFGLYDDQNTLLLSSQRINSFTATMQYFIPKTGWYSIAATSTLDNRGGDYDLSMRCTTSGCLFPYFRSNIPDVTVDFGTRAMVDLDLSVVGPFSAVLHDGVTVFGSSTTTHLVTSPILQRQPMVAAVDSPCGSTDSNVFVVQPKTAKHRAARH